MPREEELEGRLADVQAQIATQGGKVKGLKDQVKEKKKAKVCQLAVELKPLPTCKQPRLHLCLCALSITGIHHMLTDTFARAPHLLEKQSLCGL